MTANHFKWLIIIPIFVIITAYIHWVLPGCTWYALPYLMLTMSLCGGSFFYPLILLVSWPSLHLPLTSPALLILPPGYNLNSLLSSISRVNLLVQGPIIPHLASCSNRSLFHSGSHPIYIVARITFLKCALIHIASPYKLLLCKVLWKLPHHTLAVLIPPASPASVLPPYACLCHSRLMKVFLF